jgi:hypothetical protein
MRRSLFLLFFAFSVIGTCNAQFLHKSSSRNVEKGLFGKTVGSKKKVKIKEPRAVLKAKKKQEANEKKLKKEYAQSVKDSQKRTYDIQTTEVQTRMKQNQKDTDINYKTKKKSLKANSKKAGKKYT